MKGNSPPQSPMHRQGVAPSLTEPVVVAGESKVVCLLGWGLEGEEEKGGGKRAKFFWVMADARH